MNRRGLILIVDDEPDIVRVCAGVLRDAGYQTCSVQSGDEVFPMLKRQAPVLLLLDIWLQGSRLQGFDILSQLRESSPDLPVIIISGHGNIETAVAAIKTGARDFIEKPFRVEHLLSAIRSALKGEPSGVSASKAAAHDAPLRTARAQFEREYFQHLITQFRGNVSRMAQFAQMERTALHRKLRQLELSPKRGKVVREMKKDSHTAPAARKESAGNAGNTPQPAPASNKRDAAQAISKEARIAPASNKRDAAQAISKEGRRGGTPPRAPAARKSTPPPAPAAKDSPAVES